MLGVRTLCSHYSEVWLVIFSPLPHPSISDHQQGWAIGAEVWFSLYNDYKALGEGVVTTNNQTRKLQNA